MEHSPWSGPLFIIGLPRSGTKMLRSILNNHPQIKIPFTETEFLPIWISEWGRYSDLSDYKNFLRFYNNSMRLPYFIKQKKSGRLIDPYFWFENCNSYSVSEVFEVVVRYDTGTLNAPTVVWGDKSPTYIRHLIKIAGGLPNSRFVHIIRDVRDYSLSIENAWGKSKIRAAQRWVDYIRKAREDSNAINDRYMEIRYEDLLMNTSFEINRICNFIEVSFNPSMIKLTRPSEKLGDAKNESRIVVENISKYRIKMDPHTLRKIESIAGKTMMESGYCVETFPSSKRVSATMMGFYRLCDGVKIIFFMIKKTGFFSAFNRWIWGVLQTIRMGKIE